MKRFSHACKDLENRAGNSFHSGCSGVLKVDISIFILCVYRMYKHSILRVAVLCNPAHLFKTISMDYWLLGFLWTIGSKFVAKTHNFFNCEIEY